MITPYACINCNNTTSKWSGRCPFCDAWDSLLKISSSSSKKETAKWVVLDGDTGIEIENKQLASKSQKRLSTGMNELDRVLGGGIVSDSFILLGGDPGIGKSTLLLQMAYGLKQNHKNLKILYVSGEESIDQIRDRSHRMGVKGDSQIFLSTETVLDQVFELVRELKPNIIIMDSLQTFSSGELTNPPGSITQVREVASKLMALAKSASICIWLVGHVTKDGNISGPKAVEHTVDTVLYFEAEEGATFRLLRATKNRFGSTHELGVFEMKGEGLKEVANPSSLFLSVRKNIVPGIAVSASLEGSRPLLVEFQALVSPAKVADPRKTSIGMDSQRISLLTAIMEKHMKIKISERDLFFNVVGGLKITETACDLAAIAAIWSSFEDLALPENLAFVGELGLTGEVRKVSQLENRISEAKKLGFKTIVIPESSMDKLVKISGIKIIPIGKIYELPNLF